MKHYILLTIVCFSFGISLQARESNETSYRLFLEKTLMDGSDDYPGDILKKKQAEIVYMAKKMGIHARTAESMTYEVLVNALTFFGMKINNIPTTAQERFINYKMIVQKDVAPEYRSEIQFMFKKF